ncbi:hypothetical protein B5M47_03105 [candidate division CPR3 bacterium 4484_211]|uniref:Cell division protein FtsX n=1 Tax=candidate division CPR3 bacterium 4484_211 TaxID=1968527 RepID=A0A1W9NZ42_UNCC3|nr:MAG: hypothetical protein B5M47_03105 [candidate division CPR3 bacterium 4484_211]
MTLAIYAVSYFSAAVYRYNEVLKSFKEKPQLTVFFKDEATEAEILNLKTSLEARLEVKEISYISKEKALELYREQNLDKPELLEFVTADILPASLEISTTQVEFQESIARELSNNNRVESVVFHRDVVKQLVQFSRAARVEGFMWAVSLLTVSVLTILIIVGLSITAYGREIEIMKLVGAGNWYVRWPFIFQGAIYGVASAALAAGLLYLMPYIKDFFLNGTESVLLPGVSVFPVADWLLLRLWGATTILGAGLGALSSLAATWRYLKA